MTILDAFIRYDQEIQSRGGSLKTRQNYRSTLTSLNKHVGDLPVELVTYDVITRWTMDLRERGYQSSYISCSMTHLRQVMKFLRLQGIRVIDSRDIELPRIKKNPPTWLDSVEVSKLLSVIESPRDKAVVACLFTTGARVSELLQLNRDSIVDGEAQIIGKGDRQGTLYFDDYSLKLLDNYLETRKDSLRPLFVSGHYRRITVSRIEQLLHVYTDMAGIEKNVTPHVLRHSFATDLKENGADLYDVMKLLRHKNISTTMMYTHIHEKKNKKNHSKYHSKLTEN